MYALVKMAGKQFKVAQDEVIRVPHIAAEVGQSIEFNEVMAKGQGAELEMGQPFLEGAKVQAEVLGHGRDRKVRIFKKKRRKKYRRRAGHRTQYTELKITAIA